MVRLKWRMKWLWSLNPIVSATRLPFTVAAEAIHQWSDEKPGAGHAQLDERKNRLLVGLATSDANAL